MPLRLSFLPTGGLSCVTPIFRPRTNPFLIVALAALAVGNGAAIAAPLPQDTATVAVPVAVAQQVRPGPAEVALTFDDLPGIVLKPNQKYLDATNLSLVNSLVSHKFPAIGFVNEGKLNQIVRERQIAVLRLWLGAGFDLGNHTYSHSSPNKVGADGYIADIARGEKVIRPMMENAHRTLQWFRHPYLETGSPARVKAKIDAWLTAHGYKIAPVTIDCDDWEFAEPYDNAVMTGNKADADRIRKTYLAYTESTIIWDRRASQAMFGRDIAYVMLLHDTRLNADSFDGLVAIFDRQNLHPVSLAKAMSDPAYQTTDIYTGKDGIEWLERWSLKLKATLPWDDFEDVPKRIVKEYNKLDSQ